MDKPLRDMFLVSPSIVPCSAKTETGHLTSIRGSLRLSVSAVKITPLAFFMSGQKSKDVMISLFYSNINLFPWPIRGLQFFVCLVLRSLSQGSRISFRQRCLRTTCLLIHLSAFLQSVFLHTEDKALSHNPGKGRD